MKSKRLGLEKFGEIVKRSRGHLSLREYAKIVGVNKATISRIEKCVHMPTIDTVTLIAPQTEYSVEELLAILNGRQSVDKRELLLGEEALAHLHKLTTDEKIKVVESLIGGMTREERKQVISKLIFLV